jgi:serine phosphatase RsbU (regulator of sigma subunit)
MKEEVLKKVALFASLPSSEIRYLCDTLRPREFEAGTVFIHEGEAADVFFVLLDGQIEIIKALGTAEERMLGVGERGSFIGEMGLINPGSLRTASVRACTPVRMLEMTRAEFDALLHRQPCLAYKMVRVLSLRLEREENQTIRDLHEKNLQIRHAYDSLKGAQTQLVEKEKMEQELEVARGIQESMVPRKIPQLPRFNLGARMKPARAVGGDFYDFIQINESSLGIVIGDVAGKGVPAALFMALSSNLLRAEARRTGGSTGEALRHVNQQLLEINDTGMFVTVLYGVLNGATREFQYARAGHQIPLLCDGRSEIVDLPYSSALPLGTGDEILLDEQTIVLPPGSTLLLYTDGITDVLDVHDRAFGTKRLREALLMTLLIHQTASAQDICDKLLELTETYRYGSAQYDDITLAAVRVE